MFISGKVHMKTLYQLLIMCLIKMIQVLEERGKKCVNRKREYIEK